VQQDQPQRCGVDGAVVDRRQAVATVHTGREAADLVWHLARLFCGDRIVFRALATGQRAQGAEREAGAEGQREPGRPQGVAAEQGQVPGGARREEQVGRRRAVGQQQRVEVGQTCGDQAVQLGIGAGDADGTDRRGRRDEHGVGRGRGGRQRQRDGGAATWRQVQVPLQTEVVGVGDAVGRAVGRHRGRAGAGLPGQVARRHRRRCLPAAEGQDRGQVRGQPDRQRGGDVLAGVVDQLDRLPQVRGVEVTQAFEAHRRLGDRVAEVADRADEPQPLAAEGDRFVAVDQHRQLGQVTDVGDEPALGAVRAELAVRPGQHGARRADRGDEVVQERLVVHLE
jgi:hypothetical protein